MNRKDDVLPEMEDFMAVNISTERYADCPDRYQRSMPCGECIVDIVEGNNTLNCRANKEDSKGISCLPRHGGCPAIARLVPTDKITRVYIPGKVAQTSLETFRRKFADPMVLGSSDRCHTGHLSHT